VRVRIARQNPPVKRGVSCAMPRPVRAPVNRLIGNPYRFERFEQFDAVPCIYGVPYSLRAFFALY